jgi:hypothetical protein
VSCPYNIIAVVQDIKGGQDAHPTIKFTLCGTGILPVLELESSGRSLRSPLQLLVNLDNLLVKILLPMSQSFSHF